MAVDPTDDSASNRDKRDDDDDDELVPIKRKAKNLISRPSMPKVDDSLDDFIVRAKQKDLDVKEFAPEHREEGLRKEIDDLKKKLADAESRAEMAEAVNESRGNKKPWGAMAAAFVVGGALMFAVGFMMKSSPSEKGSTEQHAHTPQPPAPTPAANLEQPTPTEQVAPKPAPTERPVATGSDVAATPPTGGSAETKQPTTTANNTKRPPNVTTPKQPKQPATGGSAEPKQPATPTDPPKQPAQPAGSGSGSGELYNPF